MTTHIKTSTRPSVRFTPFLGIFGAPRVAFEPETGTGTPDAEAAAKALADQAAADKVAADKAAADKAAADAGKTVEQLAAEKSDLLREVMDKKGKLKSTETELQTAQAALAAYGGIDPAKVAALLKAEKDAEEAAAVARGDFDRVKAMMAEEHGKETKSLHEQIAALTAARAADADMIANLTVGNDFSGSSYIKDNLTLSPVKARVIYGSHFEIQDGRTVAFDKPAGKPNRTLLVNATGEPLKFDEAFQRIVEADPDKDTLLKSKIQPGSGSRTSETQTKKPAETQLFGAARIAASLGRS